MMRMPMSAAASALLRALLSRTNVSRDRVLLTEARSVEWQSFTFVGERHQFHLRIAAPAAAELAGAFCKDLADAEFAIAGQIVADITVPEMEPQPDGSIAFTIEALTIAE